MQAAITTRYSDNDTMKTTHKPRIVADSKIPYLRGILEPYALVSYHAPAEIDNRIAREADMLIVRTRTHIDSHLLQGSPCRFVATATIGYDHIDTAYCAAHGIHWVNAPGCNASSVGQYVLASLLAWANARQRHLPDLTIGIVGAGHVGKVVEQYCKAIGMRVLLNDPPRARAESAEKFVSLATIAAEADIVICTPVLVREAKEQNKSFRSHLAHLLVHSTLHAQGWDHETDEEAEEMEAREKEIMDLLGFENPYSDAARKH